MFKKKNLYLIFKFFFCRVPTAPVTAGVAPGSTGPDPTTEGPPPYDDLFPSASAPPLSHTPSPTPTITKSVI